ncbi:TetR/AcrR family transcriptional regulator [Schleiferiaceae bacterium]|jgi:AcrR family transcriptional regulator|nr:TetR/AcrR family transcriptional regulator [Schleiferiaceae bacterium]
MENDPRNTILTRSIGLFQKFGLRAVTMDDVSKELSMSKKTLYTFFSNKTDLVDQAIKHLFSIKSKQFLEQASIHENAIDELFEVQRIQEDVLKNYGTRIMYAMKKYHPETYDWMISARRNMMIEATTSNLQRGVSQKLYREDLNIPQAALIRYNTMVGIMEDPEIGEDPAPRSALLHYSLLMHIRAIATAQGIAYLQEFQQSNHHS